MANEEVYKPEVNVVEEEVQAQVVQPREPDSDTVQVHEVSVALDRVITDPSADDAVQVPEAGRSPLETDGLPIHALDANSPEEELASAKTSKKSDKS